MPRRSSRPHERRNGQMPAWGDKLGEQRVKLLAAYVTKLAAGK
jgi:mono/diheme cytochrome c family protein